MDLRCRLFILNYYQNNIEYMDGTPLAGMGPELNWKRSRSKTFAPLAPAPTNPAIVHPTFRSI